MLYWAEGSKSRNTVAFTNSDVDMQRCFVRFLKECYVIAPEDVRIAVNCHLGNGIDLGDIEAWWLQALALPVSSLRAASVNAPSRASRTRRNTLIYGTAKVVVNSTFVVQSIYGAIQEYVSIDRPEWLDCPQPQIDRISR